MRAYQGSN